MNGQHPDINQTVCLTGSDHELLTLVAQRRQISRSALVRSLLREAALQEGLPVPGMGPARPECRHGVALDHFCPQCEAVAATVEIDPLLSSLVDRHIANSPYPLPASVR